MPERERERERDRVSLCIPGCPGTHSVDQAGLKLRNPPVSASQVVGLKACTTTTRPYIFLNCCVAKGHQVRAWSLFPRWHLECTLYRE